MSFQRNSKGKAPSGKRRQLVLAPKGLVDSVLSDASTVADPIPDGHSFNEVTLEDIDIEIGGEIVSDQNSLSSLGSEDNLFDENRVMRQDMDIVTTRWQPVEVDALMTALNVNRDAVKYHFQGTGGGKDVKRQGWTDVTSKLKKKNLIKELV